MDSFITHVIVLAAVSFGIGSLVEYIKQNIKTKSDKIQRAILIFTGVILSSCQQDLFFLCTGSR